MRRYLFPLFLIGQVFAGMDVPAQELSIDQLEKQSLLYRSALWSERYASQVAKASPPALTPQTQQCLSAASVWYSIDTMGLGPAPLLALGHPEFWDLLQEMGIQAVELHGLGRGVRQANAERDYGKLADLAGMRGMLLIGNPLASLTSYGADFQLAIRGYKEYPHLFHLVEIDSMDWGFLPRVSQEQISFPIPMSTVQDLRKKGYLDGRPEKIYPYSPSSCWEATAPVVGADQKMHRWVFLRLPTGMPAVNWLDPTFAGQRLAGGELIDALLRLQQSILVLETSPILSKQMAGFSPTENAISSLSLLTRKLGGYSALRIDASLEECKGTQADLIYDRFTRPALLHALITEDAEALRLIYRIFLEEKIQPRSFIHELQPYNKASCDWTEFLRNPKRSYRYYEQDITGELLAQRLMKEDVDRLNRSPSIYTPPIAPLFGLCPDALEPSELEAQRAPFLEAHLLLTFFYAMQPGAFSFSALDLRGAGGGNPMKGGGLYPPLSRQLKDNKSFASQLKAMLRVRREHQMEMAELLEVVPTKQKGLILLVHRLPISGFLSLTAVNFSRKSLVEPIQKSYLSNRWAINLLSGQAEPKLFGSDTFELQLDPLAGKVFLFQPKYTEVEKSSF